MLLEDDSSNETRDKQQEHTESLNENIAQDDGFSESMRLLQKHGITMLPNDETSIFSSVMESGHSVVLTGEYQTI